MMLVSLCLTANVFATNYWASGVEGIWDDPAVWGSDNFPVAGDRAIINVGSTVTIDGTAQACDQLDLASWSGNPDIVTLNIINAGSLSVSGWAYLGVADGDVGEITIAQGSIFTCGGPMNVAYNGICTMIVDGGQVFANGGFYVPNIWTGNNPLTGVGTVELRSGSITTNDIAMADSGLIDITGGTLKIIGDWWINDPTFMAHIETNIVAYGGQGVVDVKVVGGDTILTATHPYQPNPAIDEVVSAGDYTLTWVLPDPNDPSGEVTCDVYLSSDYPEFGLEPGDPNFTNYADKIVDNQPLESQLTTLEDLKTYYWRIDVYDSSSDDPQPTIGPIFYFHTSNRRPTVDAGENVVTWLTEGSALVNLTGTVEDDGLPEPPELTSEWTSVPDTDVSFTDLTSPTTDVTFTATGTYTLTLTADDGELTASDTVFISVYADSCQAAIGSGIQLLPGDINADCIVDLADFALMAANWLQSIAL